MNKITLFAALTKVDEAKREVWGLATAEVVDKDGEIFDYASSRPYFEEWSREIAAATAGRSLGNVREMHRSSAVGKLVDLQFDDELKTIAVGAKIVDDAAWLKCAEGVYTGFSIGGRYVHLWPDGEFLRFTAQPAEISVVDNPAVPNAHFTAIKSDGSSEVRKFTAAGNAAMLPKAESRMPTANSQNGDIMNEPNQLDKSSQPSPGDQVQQKLESLEAGLKELADAFRKFSEGFAKSFSSKDKRVARTSVAVSKQEDRSQHPAEGGRFHVVREGAQADVDAGFLEAMKSAHANPSLGA
jgi:hypothetical protein